MRCFSIICHQRPQSGAVGGPFVHEDRRPGRQRTVDHVGVAGDPAHVGRTPVDVVVADVEDPLGRLLGEEVVAGRGVHDALGLAGRAAGVEDEQRRLAVQRLGGAVGAGVGSISSCHQKSRPGVIVTALPVRRSTTHFSTVGDFCKATSTFSFKRQLLAAPPAAVGREDQLGRGVVVPLGDRLGGEAAEDHAVDRADPGTGQHGDRQFRHQRHVDRNHVALADAQLLQHVGEPADLGVQHLVGQHAGVARLAFPDQGRLVPPRGSADGCRGSCRRRWSSRRRTTWASGSSHWSTFWNGSNQCSSPAMRPQNASRSSAASRQSFSYCAIEPMRALAANSPRRREEPLFLHHVVDLARTL